MTRAVEAHIHLNALKHNLQRVRQLVPGARVTAVVKANGYGHGMLRVAGALKEADAFGVASIEEAAELRGAGFQQRIILLSGFLDASELSDIASLQLDMVIHHVAQVEALESTPLAQPCHVWLKVDSGMHRLGVKPEQVADLRGRLSRCASVRQPVGLFTHFASADEPDSDQTRDQLAQFERATAGLAGERSIANSAAILVWPESHSDWVRPGIMLYGVSPFAERTAAAFDLQPAMTLTSRLIAVNHYRKGDAIGYGASWRCPEDMPVGVVAIGYGDGYPRHAVSGTPVLLNNCRVPLVGRVSMDSISVDLRSQPDAAAGDPVVLWGRGLPVEEIATHAGTIPYELLCRLTTRVRFIESD